MKKDINDLRISLIGAGNLATHLGKVLCRNGFRILQVYSRTARSASVLASAIGATHTDNLEEILPDADLYIVSLKDDAFLQLLPRLTARNPKSVWIHTAGSVSIQVWEGHAENYGVLYPMQTFSKQRETDFSEIPLFIEASSDEVLDMLKQMGQSLSHHVRQADSGQRRQLHLAAVFACNFTNHMYTIAADLLQTCHLPFDTLLPLIDETARKVHQLPPTLAQTGPAIRYDRQIIDKHIQLLETSPALQELYKQISQNIHEYNQL